MICISDFGSGQERGKRHAPNYSRREIFGYLRRAATAKDVATRMREHLAGLRKQHSAKTLRKIAHG